MIGLYSQTAVERLEKGYQDSYNLMLRDNDGKEMRYF